MNLVINLRKDFANLVDFKTSGNVIEVITPFNTIQGKFVSVFISWQGTTITVHDGGLLYDAIMSSKVSEQLISKAVEVSAEAYNIDTKRTSDRFEASVRDQKLLSANVFDMANFVATAINLIEFLNQHSDR